MLALFFSIAFYDFNAWSAAHDADSCRISFRFQQKRNPPEAFRFPINSHVLLHPFRAAFHIQFCLRSNFRLTVSIPVTVLIQPRKQCLVLPAHILHDLLLLYRFYCGLLQSIRIILSYKTRIN